MLTASDERQAEMVRKQLDWRREAKLLPAGAEFVVLPDPDRHRVGSGGATLRALGLRTERNPYPAGRRTLIIHSGGDSKRLPHCSAQGKLFARIPRTLPDGRASTIFDEFLIGLSGLAPILPPGALVASGDVLLVFDHLQLSFRRPGVIGVAAAASVEMGTRHGVFVTDDAPPAGGVATSEGRGHRVRAYLHKPDRPELERWGALRDEHVQIDTGLVWLDGGMLERLAVLAGNPAVRDASLNLYGDLLMPLAVSTQLDHYINDTSDGPASDDVRTARKVIWDLLRGAPLTVEQLQPAVFVHFGSSAEYWRMVAADQPLAELCGWESRTAAWTGPSTDCADSRDCGGLVLINAAIEGETRWTGSPSTPPGALLVSDSRLTGPLSWAGAGIISGVESAQPLSLGADWVVDQLPIGRNGAAGIVTRIFGLYDDPKRLCDQPDATFCNFRWSDWLQARGLTSEDLWAGIPAGQRTLWNARLFPLVGEREESLRRALPLAHHGAPSVGWRDEWRAAQRLSLAESAMRADGDRLLGQLAAIEDHVAARRFTRAIIEERPCGEAKALLGANTALRMQRAALCESQTQGIEPVAKLRLYRGLTEATGDVAWEDEGFSLLAGLIEATTPSLGRATRSRVGLTASRVRVAAAARIDLGGGWTDTPPHSIERGGKVLNAALTLHGEHPITAEARRLDEPRLILENRDLDLVVEPACVGDVLAYANPMDPFALPKAALVVRGLAPADAPADLPLTELLKETGGLHLATEARIPMGSGLGTSSILAGAVLVALSELLGDGRPDSGQLFDEVLCLEQMLTTGGGWQDQVGGLTGGIKLVTSEPGLPQRITVAPVTLDPRTQEGLAQRLCLVYTGQQRLAKNLLRNIMRRWMAREPEMVFIQAEIARLALAMRDCLLAGDLDSFGALLGEHWTLNKRMDPGCTNPFIDDLFDAMRPYIHGGKLAGAGGGGFAFVVARSADHVAGLSAALTERYPGTRVGIWPCSVPDEGIVSGL